jgi:Arc/MetJ-type ribon-helix-helix transcriptional regulator
VIAEAADFMLRRTSVLWSMEAMIINLTAKQEQQIQAMISRGFYDSVDDVVEAALFAVEQMTIPNFEGTQQELEALLAKGLASKQLSEDEFWASVNRRTDAIRAEYKAGQAKISPKDSAD